MSSTPTLDRLPSISGRESASSAQRLADDIRDDVEFVQLEPVEPERFDQRDTGLCAVIELILKDPPRLHRMIRARRFQSVLVARLLAISLASFVLFGLAMSLVLTVSGHWPSLMSVSQWLQEPSDSLAHFAAIDADAGAGRAAPWLNGNAIKLTAAYALGLVAATGVCLPSLYFYCLLAGVRLKMVDVVLHAVKAKAETAMALMGILPIYVAVAMGVIIFGGSETVLASILLLGLILPFCAGLWGTASLYNGFSQVCDTMPPVEAAERECFLRRLVLAWSACYSAVMPVMIYTLWEASARY
ncbi:MAG: hypothetical protein WD669_04260 [Pirellulales bacterium]